MAGNSIKLCTILLFSFASFVLAAEPPSSDIVSSAGAVTEVVAADTMLLSEPGPETTQEATSQDDGANTKSPPLALLRSTVLPGWGQFYTGHPYRGGLVLGLEAFLVAFTLSENNEANRNWDLYVDTENPLYFDEYGKHFDRRRTLLNVAIGLFIFNLADAYVSAHLYAFEDKVSFDQDEGRLSISMNWRVPQ